MADAKETSAGGPPEFSEADKSRARQWFKKANDCRERREYDYAIECYITGLGYWPDAVEEGHMPLAALALQRQQSGGKKPGMMEAMKKPTTGKDPRQNMLNAELLLAKDPGNETYLDALLKNANKAGLNGAVKWIAAKVFDSMKKDKKPNLTRFKAFQQIMVEAAERADSLGDLQGAGWCYEQAVNSVEYLMARNPTDMALRDQQRDLSGRLTIVKGKYGNAETFRESLRDGDKQKILHDSERAKQGESTLETLITAGRRELAEHPTVPGKINALAEALLKSDRQDHEDEAVALLLKAATDLQNYSFKVRADDIRLRSLARRARDLTDRAKTSGAEEDRQQARLAAMEQLETELDVYRERVEKYPTDLRIRFKLGAAMFRARHFDEAIPVLQAASGDPRSRSQCRLLIGRSFLEKGNHVQATEVLREALAEHELPGDDVGKELTYWLARAYEAAGRADEARAAYGNLLRQDYNYAGGEARRRMEQLAPSA